jgi:hypothetical protein
MSFYDTFFGLDLERLALRGPAHKRIPMTGTVGYLEIAGGLEKTLVIFASFQA